MKSYVVGGAVRDRLLGLTVHDRDYVVVGSTPEAMIAAGFLPVGRDFPVFLHPDTKEEYALARSERKTAPGYGGFTFHTDPDITLEQDLERRDLTINAMAEDEAQNIIDPFHGQRDLELRLFRHVGPAFIEDPVRILRVARFAARFPEFQVAPETMLLMQRMVDAGEVDALVVERVWQEWARGLCETRPDRMLDILAECGALARLAPALVRHGAPWERLREAALQGATLAVRFAVWMGESQLSEGDLNTLCTALRVPAPCRELAQMVLREGPELATAADSAEQLLGSLERTDALRRPERFEEVLVALAILQKRESANDATLRKLRQSLAVARAVDAGAVARQTEAAHIAREVRAARLRAIADAVR